MRQNYHEELYSQGRSSDSEKKIRLYVLTSVHVLHTTLNLVMSSQRSNLKTYVTSGCQCVENL